MDSFEKALMITLSFEGGYSNHGADRGGETNHGITKAVAIENGYTGDMRVIPKDVVEKIYRLKYWDVCKCGQMTEPMGIVVFDSAVNHGPSRAAKLLQKTFGMAEDGIIGPKTMSQALIADMDDVKEFLENRRKFYDEIIARDPTQLVFKAGWHNRINALELAIQHL